MNEQHDLLAELLADPLISRADKLELFDRQIAIDTRRAQRYGEIEKEIAALLAHIVPSLDSAAQVFISPALFARVLCLLNEQTEWRYWGDAARCFTYRSDVTGKQVPFAVSFTLSGDQFRVETAA